VPAGFSEQVFAFNRRGRSARTLLPVLRSPAEGGRPGTAALPDRARPRAQKRDFEPDTTGQKTPERVAASACFVRKRRGRNVRESLRPGTAARRLRAPRSAPVLGR
jgi:hypothetical protein